MTNFLWRWALWDLWRMWYCEWKGGNLLAGIYSDLCAKWKDKVKINEETQNFPIFEMATFFLLQETYDDNENI